MALQSMLNSTGQTAWPWIPPAISISRIPTIDASVKSPVEQPIQRHYRREVIQESEKSRKHSEMKASFILPTFVVLQPATVTGAITGNRSRRQAT